MQFLYFWNVMELFNRRILHNMANKKHYYDSLCDRASTIKILLRYIISYFQNQQKKSVK